MSAISDRAIARLISYRSLLRGMAESGSTNVFSHQIADTAGGTAAQVRRDLMMVGYNGSPRNGYHVEQLTSCIDRFLGAEDSIPFVVVGVGNLGRAILTYFSALRPRFTPVASFDADPNKANRVICGCPCHPIDNLVATTTPLGAHLGIITVPAAEAQRVAELLVEAGVSGIVNFAPIRLKLPRRVYVEHMDMTMAFEKAAFFARQTKQ